MTLDPLEYVLNRMENAARSSEPAKNGYGDARRELIDGIRTMRARIKRLEEINKSAHDLLNRADKLMLGYAGAEAALDCNAAKTVAKLKDAVIGEANKKQREQKAEIERLKAVLEEIHVRACLAECLNCEPAWSSIAKEAAKGFK